MKCYGLLGKKLGHSFSKGYFTDKFQKEHIADAVYNNYELAAISELSELIASNPDLKGLNVTIPYKEEVIPFLHFKNDIVADINACNCIKINPSGELDGYNTDVIGFTNSLQPRLQSHHNHAIVLGTGGASKAVQYALKKLNIDYKVASRSTKEGAIQYEDLNDEVVATHKLIINTTPLGMFPDIDNMPFIKYDLVTDQHLLFDLVYNPPKTKFLLEGEKRGAQILNGYEMLVMQAEESWRIWNEL
ncbi:MAG TPA: shikimate dehydrogenase [Flavisolibacter sp.]|nr:shikimate dehydrogenase [Flavisolibacter sp.]